jgi:hypothetical protein
MPDPDLDEWFRRLMSAAEAEEKDHSQAIHEAYQTFENAGLISKVTVHRYLCRTRCRNPRATVIREGRGPLRAHRMTNFPRATTNITQSKPREQKERWTATNTGPVIPMT